MNYSLDEAASIISEKINKPITARQIRELAIKGATALSFIYRGTATNCTTQAEENIYGWPYVLPGYITEIEMNGSYPANMFVYNDTVYKIVSPNYAVTLTVENLLIDEAHISDLINNLTTINQAEEGNNKRPKSQQRFQEDEILRVIKQLGYTPESLPKQTTGKPWVKSAVKSELSFSVSVFNKAWERLRADKRIQDK